MFNKHKKTKSRRFHIISEKNGLEYEETMLFFVNFKLACKLQAQIISEKD